MVGVLERTGFGLGLGWRWVENMLCRLAAGVTRLIASMAKVAERGTLRLVGAWGLGACLGLHLFALFVHVL